MSVGERLRDWRKSKKLSTTQVHDATGISTGALSNYENDLREIGSDFLIKLYEIYNADIMYILTGVKDEKLLSDEQEQLLQYFNICDDETKTDILRFVRRCAVTQNDNAATNEGKSSDYKIG